MLHIRDLAIKKPRAEGPTSMLGDQYTLCYLLTDSPQRCKSFMLLRA